MKERRQKRKTEWERASEQETNGQTIVQSGGTRGARKALVCRGPPHWHTVVCYDPFRTSYCPVISDSHFHECKCSAGRRSNETTLNRHLPIVGSLYRYLRKSCRVPIGQHVVRETQSCFIARLITRFIAS